MLFKPAGSVLFCSVVLVASLCSLKASFVLLFSTHSTDTALIFFLLVSARHQHVSQGAACVLSDQQPVECQLAAKCFHQSAKLAFNHWLLLTSECACVCVSVCAAGSNLAVLRAGPTCWPGAMAALSALERYRTLVRELVAAINSEVAGGNPEKVDFVIFMMIC